MALKKATFRLSFTGEDIPKLLKSLGEKVSKTIIRQAIRSALRPARLEMKAITLSIARQSRRGQGTGATSRAVSSKYGQSKSNRNRFYGIVGVNNKYWESIQLKPSSKFKTRFGGYAEPYNLKRRGAKALRQSSRKEVNSLLRRSPGPKNTKRVPRSYFWLIDKGFTHARNGRKVLGYEIIDNTMLDTYQQVQSIFSARMTELIGLAMRGSSTNASSGS